MEVLLAVAILGAGLTILVATTARCLAVARRAREYEVARYLLAQFELTHPLQLEEEIIAGSEEGSFDPPYENYRWSRKIEPVEAFELLPGAESSETRRLFQVTTRISWHRRGWRQRGGGFEEVTTYLYYPGKRGSFTRSSPP